MTMETVRLSALVAGLGLGSAMLVIACVVFLKKNVFGLGGSVLSLFGLVLVGLSVWTSFDLSISPKGEIKAAFVTQQIYSAVNAATRDVIQDTRATQIVAGQSQAALPRAAAGTVEKLKQAENVSRLTEEKKYEEALALDPRNTIALMGYIQEQVLRGNYEEATKYFQRLQKANDSGVGYSAYPDVAFAFERTGKSEQAKAVLTELGNRIAQDIAQGYGYLSRSQQLEWVDTSLRKAEALVSNQEVRQAIKSLRSNISDDIKTLRGS
jgi:tetratricopeptide (TPR) repeat protein